MSKDRRSETRQAHAGAWLSRLGMAAAVVLAMAILALAIAVPMNFESQFAFAVVMVLATFVLDRFGGRRITIAMAIMSALVTTRYLYWRTTETLHFRTAPEAVLGLGLYAAELYTWLILLLGYLQTTWPLNRPVAAMRGEASQWPTIDVYVPTYNETLQIVQDTVLAAMAMDYPRDRFRVFLLDDGRRDEFRAFAKEAGVAYITRPDNAHAKAGNLNNALSQTDGELVCVFDADHIPTRAFLQMTVGWFQADPKLALLQTPHHFYSPDPAQRNLTALAEVPDEGALFYGSVQPGNDFWNAAFFCGSCAVIRREALEDTHGFAGETVTEDAHTALKMQRLGWNTAYLNVRLASGLATERLALHIGQRARWARGMSQIFRIDNPLLGPGLTWAQRLCYLNAALHFQFPLPRIVFLTSPLAFLFFGQNVIQASAAMIAVFAAPHLIQSVITNNRIQGSNRRAFWGEVYETLLAFHLALPTVLTLIDPKRGKFNVTDKGGLLEHAYFDFRLMAPHLITVALLIAGVVLGFTKLLLLGDTTVQLGTLVLNTSWTIFNLLILLTAVAVARETRQLRSYVRVEVQLPVRLTFPDGVVHQTVTREVSMGGLSTAAPPSIDFSDRQFAGVTFQASDRFGHFPARIVQVADGIVHFQFLPMSVAMRRRLVGVVMGRADAWQPTHATPSANPLLSFVDLVTASLSLFRPQTTERRRKSLTPTPVEVSAAATVATALVLAFAPLAHAQTQTQTQAPAPAPAPATAPAAATAGGRQVVLTLRGMGVDRPLRLAGVQGEAGIPFDLRRDEVVTDARLHLNFGYSPSLLPDLSSLSALINDELVGTLRLTPDGAGGATVDFPVDPALLLPENRLNLRFAGHYTRSCEDPQHSSLWTNISNVRSALHLTLQRLPPQPDLARLPAPFFDRGAAPLRLPFVFAGNPANGSLQAAAAAASYFGMAASYRGFSFPVLIDTLPEAEGVVFAAAGDVIPGLELPEVNGPTLAIVVNPANPDSSLLLVLGRDPGEIRQAALALAVGAGGLSGQSVQVAAPGIPLRAPYDAPKWLRTDRPVRLGELADASQLQVAGIQPAPINVSFRAAPDLFFWPRGGAPLAMRYRYPDGPWLNRETSRLDVSLNEQFLRSFRLTGRRETQSLTDRLLRNVALFENRLELPPYQLFGQNQLQFYFDLKARKAGACQDQLPTNVRSGIDPDTSIDLRGARHYAPMPNLAFFASAGFPFTRMADLSETLVLMSTTPTPPEIEAFLLLMGRFADSTGAPVTRVSIARAGATIAAGGRDVLVLGPLQLATAYDSLFRNSPVRLEGGGLRLQIGSLIDRLFSAVRRDGDEARRARLATLLLANDNFAGLISFRSPQDPQREVVAVLASDPTRLPDLAGRLSDPAENARVQGDLTIDDEGDLSGYRVGPTFWRGDLPPLVHVMWWLSGAPVLFGLIVVGAILLVSGVIHLGLTMRERNRLRQGRSL